MDWNSVIQHWLIKFFSSRALPLRNVCITKTQICCYSIPPDVQYTAHTQAGYDWALTPTTTSFSVRKWLLENLGSKDFPFLSENMDNVPVGPICSCILRSRRLCGIKRIPWGQRPGSGSETLLLETEVLGVDLSIWVSTMGFCTSRKRWKGLYSSPCRVVVGARIVLVQLYTECYF